MGRFFRTSLFAVVIALSGGCGAAFDLPPRPARVSHMDIAGKQAYIHDAKSTLKIFQAAARDIHGRSKPRARQELAGEFSRYVELQVKPIVDDFEAGKNLETRLEIAKLEVLCGLVYLELEEYRKSWRLLRQLEGRYGDQPDLLKAAIDPNDIGFGSIDDGIQSLRKHLSRKKMALPFRSAF